MVFGGYLYSTVSPGIWLSVDNTGPEALRIHLEGESDAAARQLVRRIAYKLLKQSRAFRAAPLIPFIQYSEPGRGYHSGGTFPMRDERIPHSSDVEGRPYGFDRVHLVDASTFPSIPSSPITLSAMANAYRIATLAAARGS